MHKSKFITLTSTAIPLPVENIDTDQIIPARFLKATTREGFGENLFRDWRFDPEGKKKEFVLNDPRYTGSILIAGKNFGCGSSREHAAWALYDYGFRVVISSFFADIFRSNALNNSLLPLVVNDTTLQMLFTLVLKNPRHTFIVDLAQQTLTDGISPLSVRFEVDPYKKECMMNGYDDVDYLISLQNKTIEFENIRSYPH